VPDIVVKRIRKNVMRMRYRNILNYIDIKKTNIYINKIELIFMYKQEGEIVFEGCNWPSSIC
jgi:hypothetical protein